MNTMAIRRPTYIVAMLAAIAMAVATMAAWSPRAHAVQAPEFTGIAHWINSKPLTMQELRGKVVLIDFWAYSCINCLRTFPHVTHWYDKYKDDGFVVVGVHSPEFDFGKNPANVERAVKHFNIHYPVAMDNNMDTWRAWRNEFWPAEYLVNQKGEVVLHHFGEGHYRDMENAIRHLLGLAPLTGPEKATGPDFAAIGSPEMYFGLARVRNMANTDGPSSTPHTYHAPGTPGLNQYVLDGTWRMTPEFAELTTGSGAIHLRFQASKLYMVAASDKPITLTITVDGKPQPSVTVHASKLYTLFDGKDYRTHTVSINIPGPGLRAYTFTFG